MSFLLRTTRLTQSLTCISTRTLTTTTANMANPKLDSQTISQITEAEKNLTGESRPVKGGPTAQAQAHAGQPLKGETVSSITQAERALNDGSIQKGGPSAVAQSAATSGTSAQASSQSHNGTLDSATISAISEAERKLTGQPQPVKGGPTAQAQKHAGEAIGSENLSDITKGEKKVAGERVGGGPTSVAQSELGKSRS